MPRPSRLEDILLRSREGAGGIRHTLFCLLDDGVSLPQVRLASRALHDLISHHKNSVFRHLYVQSASLDSDQKQKKALIAIGPYCQHLTITVSELASGDASVSSPPKRSLEFKILQEYDSRSKDGSVSLVETLERQIGWRKFADLFYQLVNLYSLTLRVCGDRDWPGFTSVERQLTDIRVAIENVSLTRLRTLTMMPVHAMGIVHLQWSSLHAFGQCPTPKLDVWQRLENLDMRIYKPSKLTEPQGAMFNKQLYVYFSSFAPTLRKLCFVWLYGIGPSPLALQFEVGLGNRRPIVWARLNRLWLGNVAHLHRTIRLIPDVAPSLTSAMTLREEDQGMLSVGPDDASAWVKILLDSQKADIVCASDGARSVHSGQSSERKDPSTSGVSSTSMLVPIVLDLK